MTARGRLVAVGVLLGSLTGCSSQQPGKQALIDFQRTGWGQPPPEGAVAGVDYGCLGCLTWEDRVVLVIWTDNENTYGTSNLSRSGDRGQDVRCDFAIGERVKGKFRVLDGTTGSVTVNGQEFDLADGWLLLVSAAGGESRVKQLRREEVTGQLGPAGGNTKNFEKLKADPEVVAFYAGTK